MKKAIEMIIRASEAPEFGIRKEFETREAMERFYYDNFRNCRGRKFVLESREGYHVTEELLMCQDFHYHITTIDRSEF